MGPGWSGLQTARGVRNPSSSRTGLERPAAGGKSPVGERWGTLWAWHPSNAGHVESRVNLGGPPPKAKDSLATDSELVP